MSYYNDYPPEFDDPYVDWCLDIDEKIINIINNKNLSEKDKASKIREEILEPAMREEYKEGRAEAKYCIQECSWCEDCQEQTTELVCKCCNKKLTKLI